ncbi:2-C-methyl-D-erythritol 4-phosphate cytidylyltransferase [Psychrobacter sp. B38]|uniref:2-C-methyl-D-erythritol 4-phosphate cytidylyltransferase n=1 Tax=Psychrobacter sp. B38 TaxID=3143538 RepID=UPI003210F083
MNKSPRIYAMIVAAGRGSRFGAPVAKQYTMLQGQTLLQHSVARLACSKYIDQCLLVIAAKDSTAQTLDFMLPVRYTVGGEERWQSVQAGVAAIDRIGADDADLVLIHDAARPVVPRHDIDQVIEAAMGDPYGAILATPVADTLKTAYTPSELTEEALDVSYKHTYAKRTIDRSHMWQAQTPQVFRLGALRQVLNHVSANQLTITDEASAFEYLDLPIRLVTGSRQNLKLTYPDDAVLIGAILTAQSTI